MKTNDVRPGIPEAQGFHATPPGRTAASIRFLSYLVVALGLAAGVGLALAHTKSEYGPIASETGAAAIGTKPEEGNCTVCHFDPFDPTHNTLNTPGGGIRLVGLPATYDPGVTYPITVELHTDSTASSPYRKWGFQITAVRARDGEGAGTFIIAADDTLQMFNGDAVGPYGSRTYVEHNYPGVRWGQASPSTWTFSWQAPSTPQGTIRFFMAGNAANGSFDPSGDFIFTGSDSMRDGTVPVRPISWGSLKARYR
jgi:hypothetical protein